MVTQTKELERLQAALADPELYNSDNNKALRSLQVEAGYAAKALSEAEEAWIELQEALEVAEAEVLTS